MERPIPRGDEWVVVARAPISRPRPATHVPGVRFVWVAVWVVDMLCALRFCIRLLGALAAAPVAGLVYSGSDPLVAPFQGVFPEAGAGRFVWEPSALVAILVYTPIAVGVVALVRIVTARRPRPAGFQ